METLYFTLGVLAVIDVLLVVGAFLVLKTLNQTRNQAEQIQRDLESNIQDTFRELERVESQLNDKINRVEEQVVRHTDSRVDKLESKVYKDFDLIRTQGRQY